MNEIDDLREFKLRYVGRRFENARLPLDVISDLPAFRDLIAAFAKETWRRDNAGRQRLPRGFEESISFDLVDVEEGSAVPAMAWNRGVAQQHLPGISDYLEDLVDGAFTEITSIIDKAVHNQFPQSLPTDAIRAFNRLGAGLKQDEKIEFLGKMDAEENVIYLDVERRKRLLKGLRSTYEMRTQGIGRLYGMDADTGFIMVDTVDHGDLRIPVDPSDVRKTFQSAIDAFVQFDLLVELDHQDKLIAIRQTYDVDLVEEDVSINIQKLNARLDHLRSLQPGWHNDAGSSLADVAISNAAKLIAKRSSLTPLFRIFPTVEGGVLMEFQIRNWDLSVEMLSNGQVEFFGIDVESDLEIEPMTFEDVGHSLMREIDGKLGPGERTVGG